MAGAETLTNQGAATEYRETESQGSRVVFYGYPHHQLNLEGIPHIIDSFRTGLERQPRNATLFLETHYLPESNARHWERLVDALGGLANLRIAQLIAEEGYKLPDREEIEAKRRALMVADFAELVTSNVLPTKYVEPIHLGREVDTLRREHTFEIAFESHPPQIARTLEGMQTGSDELRSAASNHFMQKDFEATVSDWKSHVQLEHMIKSTRHRFNLADIRRRLAAGGEGSFIFILAGTSHLVLADELRANLPKDDSTEIEAVSNTSYSELPEFRLHQLLNRGEEPEDELCAQDFIEGIFGMEVLNRLDERVGDKEALRKIAHNFEKFSTATARMASALSLDEIREMCLDHDKVYDYIDQSPHAEPIRGVLAEPQQAGARSVSVRPSREAVAVDLLESDPLQPFVEGKVISARDAQMIHLHYKEKLPFDKVGERLNLSQNTIRQYTSGALGKLPDEIRRQLRGY